MTAAAKVEQDKSEGDTLSALRAQKDGAFAYWLYLIDAFPPIRSREQTEMMNHAREASLAARDAYWEARANAG